MAPRTLGAWFDDEGDDAAETVVGQRDRADLAEAALTRPCIPTVEFLEGSFNLGQGHLVSSGDRDVAGTSGELEESVFDPPLVTDRGPTVGASQLSVGGAGDIAVGAGGGSDPDSADLSVGQAGTGFVADLDADGVVDRDPGAVAVTTVADEPDLGGTVIADQAGVGEDLGESRADGGRQVRTPGDDEVETEEVGGCSAGRLGEGLDHGGHGDDASNGFVGDARAHGEGVEVIGDVDAAAGGEAFDDGVEGEAVGHGAGGQGGHFGEGFEVGRGHGHIVAVLLAGLDEGLRIARRAGGEKHEERLGRFADARRCGVGRVDGGFAGTEVGRGDNCSGPSCGGERLGELGRVADDEADSGGGDDSDLVVERPAGVDGGRDRAESGKARDDAGGLERRGEAHCRDRGAVGFGSRIRRVGLGTVEGVDGGEHRGRIPDELSIGEGTWGS